MVAPLPSAFASTREALHALACYVIAPARKARTGRIGLRSTGDGFGTPRFDDGSRILVRGDRLVHEPVGAVAVTTLRAAADFLGVELTSDPGVGHDLPPYAPESDLAVDAEASLALGDWYAFGQDVLDRLAGDAAGGEAAVATVSEAQLWPEHFDLAVVVELGAGHKVNVGFSPGDTFHPEPYAYVGPHDADDLVDEFWNAPFGAFLAYDRLVVGPDPTAAALDFVRTGLSLLPS